MNYRWLASGLFLVTLATLMLEILDSRLLSVLTWYHLAFLTVSLAMLGMAAGAVLVFVGGERYAEQQAIRELPRVTVWFAIAIPLMHLGNLTMPIPVLEQFRVREISAIVFATLVLGLPFLLAGVAVTLALTRSGGSTSRLYAADLLGAAIGCLVVVPLLDRTNITSVAFVAGAVAAAGAYCFDRFALVRLRAEATAESPVRRALPVRDRRWFSIALCLGFLAAAALNAVAKPGIGVVYAKNRIFRGGGVDTAGRNEERVEWSAWNTHSYIMITPSFSGPAFYWGRGRGADQFQATSAWILIDADAGTPITKWDGNVGNLGWVSYDVTTLPYHLRKGNVGIIGVGGGRDILSALWGGNTSVTGIEINKNLLRALQGPYRDFANLVNRPEVQLVHGEARSYLSRTDKRFDVLQMSLIDTWASTGAGAFTLTENGLYTIEGWRLFLERLAPGGLFSVSRWFSPGATSETSRLLALAVAALLDRGVQRPLNHMAMLSRYSVATLIVSNRPLTDEDRSVITKLADERQFDIVVSPWTGAADPFLSGIVKSSSVRELDAAIRHPMFDFTPPTDERPFFFNTLKPSSFHKAFDVPRDGVISGNLRATWTLVLLFIIATVLVIGIIIWPLFRSGLPSMESSSFAMSVSYFGMIGVGYMLIQIPFLQRFSVYLGHPTYTFAIILFSMICFTGIGSFVSDRFPIEHNRWVLKLPLAIGASVLLLIYAIQPIMDATIQFGLPVRSLVVIACSAPISVLLGFCFPVGMTLVSRLSPDATAWMWGINGAAGVLASIMAVAISMWLGIHVNLLVAGLLYILLPVPAHMLERRSFRSEGLKAEG
jgi:spermidine synthase